MKRILTYLLPLLALLSGACSKDTAEPAEPGNTGTLKIDLTATRADIDGSYDPWQHLAVRIFNAEGGLLRKYTSADDIPQLALLAGNYRVSVEAGEIKEASFTERYFKGEETFTVTAGEVTPVEVKCALQNTVVEAKFHASITENFTPGYSARVAVGGTYDQTGVLEGKVPSLKYSADAKGYFTLPEGVTEMSWHFEGTHAQRGEIVKEGKISDLKVGGRYGLTFKFSPDLPGYVEVLLITVDPSTDDKDDTIIFSPDPKIEGDGFDMKQLQRYTAGERTFLISTMAELQSVVVSFGGESHTLFNGTTAVATEGIRVEPVDGKTLRVTFTDALFTPLTAGDHLFSFHITDKDKGEATAEATFRLQGLLPVADADYDLWTNALTLRAVVFDPAATVTFGYRTQEGTWNDLAGTAEGDDLFAATAQVRWIEDVGDAGQTVYRPDRSTGVFAGGNYECRVTIGGVESDVAAFSTGAGQLIPGGDMEEGSMSCFNNGHGSFWDSGNNSMTSSLCSQSSYEGNEGTHCAKLAATKPIALVNLAAGNLFTGSFSQSGTSGTVAFGKYYEWEARPTAMHVKYYAETLGTVNQNQHNGPLAVGEQDKARIFVAIVDWSGTHTVVSGSKDPTGIWDPATTDHVDEGRIIGYGSIFIDKQSEGGTMIPVDIPIKYYDTTTKPTGNYTLVISCATSAYGDYMNGCTTNVLYVDDFKWVY